MNIPISEIEAQNALHEINKDFKTKFQSLVGNKFSVSYNLNHKPHQGVIESTIYIKKKERVISKKVLIEISVNVSYKVSQMQVITPTEVSNKIYFEGIKMARRFVETGDNDLNIKAEEIVNMKNFPNFLLQLRETVGYKFDFDDIYINEFDRS